MAKNFALVMGIIGFVAGIVYAVGGLFYDLFTTGGVNWGTALAFLAIIGMPIMFGVVGYIIGRVAELVKQVFRG